MESHIHPDKDFEPIKDEDIYLDKFIQDIAGWKRVLKLDFEVIKKYFHNNNEALGKIYKFEKAFFFKLDRIFDCFINLEKEILTSSMDSHYYTLHGLEYNKEKIVKKVTNSVDLFLTQFFSLFDIFIKSIRDLAEEEIPKKVDGLGLLFDYLENNKKSNSIFDPIAESKKSFSELKDYRDYIIHQGNLNIEPVSKRIENGYSLDMYFVDEIKRESKKKYSEKSNQMLRINTMLRVNLRKQLIAFHKTISKLNNN